MTAYISSVLLYSLDVLERAAPVLEDTTFLVPGKYKQRMPASLLVKAYTFCVISLMRMTDRENRLVGYLHVDAQLNDHYNPKDEGLVARGLVRIRTSAAWP